MRWRDRIASFSWAGWDGEKMWPRENFYYPKDGTDGTVRNARETENIFTSQQSHSVARLDRVRPSVQLANKCLHRHSTA